MNLAVEFTASLCGGWLTDDPNHLVRRGSLARRPAAHAAPASTRKAAQAVAALQARWFDAGWFYDTARVQDGREWLAPDVQLRSIGWALPRY
jgi:hypothetical protein